MKNSDLVQAFYNWYRSTLRHPKYRWLIILGSLLYLVSPIDILPDLIPFVGWIDDGIIATLLVSEVSQLLLDRLNRRGDRDVDAASQSAPHAATGASTTIDVDAEQASI